MPVKLTRGAMYSSANNPNFQYRIVSTGPKQTRVVVHHLNGDVFSGKMLMVKTSFAVRDFQPVASST